MTSIFETDKFGGLAKERQRYLNCIGGDFKWVLKKIYQTAKLKSPLNVLQWTLTYLAARIIRTG